MYVGQRAGVRVKSTLEPKNQPPHPKEGKKPRPNSLIGRMSYNPKLQ